MAFCFSLTCVVKETLDLGCNRRHDGCVEKCIKTGKKQCTDNNGDQNLNTGIHIRLSSTTRSITLAREKSRSSGFVKPNESVRLPCGSASINNTFLPFRTSPVRELHALRCSLQDSTLYCLASAYIVTVLIYPCSFQEKVFSIFL